MLLRSMDFTLKVMQPFFEQQEMLPLSKNITILLIYHIMTFLLHFRDYADFYADLLDFNLNIAFMNVS